MWVYIWDKKATSGAEDEHESNCCTSGPPACACVPATGEAYRHSVLYVSVFRYLFALLSAQASLLLASSTKSSA